MKITREGKFELGQLLITPGAQDELDRNDVTPIELLRRHVGGDWGEMPEEDKKLNDAAVVSGEERLMSSYKLPKTGDKVWVITEWDRSVTTILLPSEY